MTFMLPYNGIITRIKTNHKVSDIVKQILSAHELHMQDYDLIAGSFWRGSVKKTADYLFDWCKANIPYNKEPGSKQTSRSPGAILALSKRLGGDCKHYALWIAGVLDALRRVGYPVQWRFAFASYDQSKVPGHVFVIVKVNGSDYWIDPVLSFVNKRVPEPDHIIFKTMALDHISGVGATRVPSGSVSETLTITDTAMLPGETAAEFAARLRASQLDNYTGINPYDQSGGDGAVLPGGAPGVKINPMWIAGGLLVLYFVFKKRKK